MAYLSTENNYCFIHIYKNAGTSVKNALQELEPNALKPQSFRWKIQRKVQRTMNGVFMPRERGLNRLIQINAIKHGHLVYQDVADNLDVSETKFFAVCRNPWDWQVSLYRFVKKFDEHYQNKMISGMSFGDYIHWRCTKEARLQKNFLVDFTLNTDDFFMLRFEKLHEDWERLSEHLRVELPALPHVNRSREKDEEYKNYYTPKTREMVEKTFKQDIELFQYSFDD